MTLEVNTSPSLPCLAPSLPTINNLPKEISLWGFVKVNPMKGLSFKNAILHESVSFALPGTASFSITCSDSLVGHRLCNSSAPFLQYDSLSCSPQTSSVQRSLGPTVKID